MDLLVDAFSWAQQTLFEAVVQPLAFELGQGNLLEDAYDGTGWVVVGVIQLLLMLLLMAPLERWMPVDPMRDRRAVRVDVVYTLIHRLGLFKLFMFFTFENMAEQALAPLRALGLGTLHLDQWWPGVTDLPWVSFVIYLLVFDLVNYWIHRAQHQFEWWWALHALHHSQRQMTMWSDNRNHLLDDILRDVIFVGLSLLIGVGPGQFVALVAFTQLSESFQHANVRLWFGAVGERLWVSPRFHRLHHSIGLGHETVPVAPAQAVRSQALGGHNFGVLLPWWDMLFGTANFEYRFDPTGIRDQVESGRDYGSGFWQQQWLGVKRLFGKA